MVMLMRSAANAVWALICLVSWLHRVSFVPVADWWIVSITGPLEELCKGVVRESFAFWYRFVNGVSAVFVSLLLERGYWTSQRTAWRTDAGARAEWGNESTLNAFVSRLNGMPLCPC